MDTRFSPQTDGERLPLGPDCLVFFIDDTGHERLKGHSIYGLGGCAVMGVDYQRSIMKPWLRRRVARYGASTAPMHAVEYGHGATRANLAAMNQFFARQAFFRFAVLATKLTQYPNERELMSWVMFVLKRRIADIANRTAARSVALVFEASNRADSLVIQHFGLLDLTETGRPITVEHCFMPKSSREPGLEVADFVIHTAGRYVRHRLAGRPGFPRDFEAIFHRCEPRLTSFLLVDRIERGAAVSVPAEAAVKLTAYTLDRI